MASLINTRIRTTRNSGVWDAIVSDINRLDNKATKVGFPEGADLARPFSQTGVKHSDTMTELAQKAAQLEFGAPHLRGKKWPFMTQSFMTNLNKLKRQSASEFRRMTRNISAPVTALEQIGEKHEEQIRKQMWLIRTPKLSDFTVAAKGSSKPLIDTGLMVNSVTHREGRRSR